jgi:DNA repair protein RadC
MKEIPYVDRPRERLAKLGPSALSNTELLAIILGYGAGKESVLKIAENILRKFSSTGLIYARLEDLEEVFGIGKAKATKLIACFELCKRLLLKPDEEKIIISSPKDVYEQTKEIRKNKREHFISLFLDAKNQLIVKETISIGSLNANIVHPREVFQPAVGKSAAGIILVHNHPSGDLNPSEDDIELTQRLVKAGEIMGIEVLDHIIVGKDGFMSMKEKDLI